jgi:hypothetical protein
VLPTRLLFQIAGNLCANFASPSRRPPYLRALTQVSLSAAHDCGNSLITVKSVFFNNQRILEVYPIGWVVDRFFLETLGLEYKTLCAVTERAAGLPLFTIERKLSRVRNIVLVSYSRQPHFQMLLTHIQSAWYNPPRRRRFLARSLLGWQELYDTASVISKSGNPMVSRSYLTKFSLIEI